MAHDCRDIELSVSPKDICSAAIWMGKQRQSGWESGVAMLA